MTTRQTGPCRCLVSACHLDLGISGLAQLCFLLCGGASRLFKKKFKLHEYKCFCLCVCLCTTCMQGQQKPEEGIKPPETPVPPPLVVLITVPHLCCACLSGTKVIPVTLMDLSVFPALATFQFRELRLKS